MDLLAEASLKAIDDVCAENRDFDSVYSANFATGELSRQTAIAGGEKMTYVDTKGLRRRNNRRWRVQE